MKAIVLFIYIVFLSLKSFAGDFSFLEKESQITNRGVWVSVFNKKRALSSKEGVFGLIDTCKKYKLNEIYLQVYRSGNVYYGLDTMDDSIDFLLNQAKDAGIKVFAWFNILSLSQNKDADIIKKFGDSVLTRDQYLRPSSKGDSDNQSDKYYLRENQLFLEPGDPNVCDYILGAVDEVLRRYPNFSGIHLDYIRYPYPVPYTPGSKFANYGLIYGYGEKNVSRFKEATGIDPLVLGNADNYLIWDNWKREQVTSLVKKISTHLKENSPEMLISCAVISSPERAYSVVFQDWPLWLDEGLVDYVVLMNYTKDNQSAKEVLKSASCLKGQGKVYNGIGLFLMNENPDVALKQFEIIEALKPDGVTFFSYDDLSIY